jgi:hypothetical protein
MRPVGSKGIMRTPIAALILGLAAGTLVQAQSGVDFSGRWMLESPAATDTPTAISVEQRLVTTNVRGEPMQPFYRDVTIEREVGGSILVERRSIGALGGTVGSLPADPGATAAPSQHYSVTWDTDNLVFEFGSHTGPSPETGLWTERRERWSLDADGRLQVAVTIRSSSAAPATVTAIYRRQ